MTIYISVDSPPLDCAGFAFDLDQVPWDVPLWPCVPVLQFSSLGDRAHLLGRPVRCRLVISTLECSARRLGRPRHQASARALVIAFVPAPR